MKKLKFLLTLTMLSMILIVSGCDKFNDDKITSVEEDNFAEIIAAENALLALIRILVFS